MAPPKSCKQVDQNPWGWAPVTKPEAIEKVHVYCSYRIIGFSPCSEPSKRNCKRNPYCYFGLGEKKWKEDNEGEDDEESAAFRCEGEYAGLQNLGATCYVNSLLQLWYHNPIFRPAILKWTPAPVLKTEVIPDYKPNCPLSQLQAIFARLKISKRSKIDPSDFIKSLMLNTGEQQDAQEFAKLFMELIVKLLTDYGDDQIRKLIAQSFNGQLQYETECLGCKNKTRRAEGFTELNLSVKKNLNESLDELLADETISEYKCSNCQQNNTVKRRMQLVTLPPVLNLQLLRFVYDRDAQRRKKVTQNISFPEVLDMQHKIHQENNQTNKGGHKYHLTAVLIHNGQSASSGHYVAQIKDLKNGEWLKFNDEFVDPVSKKTQKTKEEDTEEPDKKRTKTSKNSPSLNSPGAYMLVYTLEDHIINPEPDPEVHQYLVDLVHREDSTFEIEVNKNKSEKDFEQAVRNQRRKEVEWLYELGKKPSNGTVETEGSEEVEEPKPKIPRYDSDSETSVTAKTGLKLEVLKLSNKKRSDAEIGPCDSTKNGTSNLNQDSIGDNSGLALDFPHRKHSYEIEEMDFISVDWITQWLDPGNPVPPIENAMLVCEHKKLAPPHPNSTACLYRLIPTPLANTWYEHYQGGPRLNIKDLCEQCVVSQYRRLRDIAELDSDSKLVSDLQKKCDAECSTFIKGGQPYPDDILNNKCWINKESLKNWKKWAKAVIDKRSPDMSDELKIENETKGNSEDGAAVFNADLFCEHGNMTPDVGTRKLIYTEAWNIFEKYFESAVMLSATEVSSCDECRNQEEANSVVAQKNKEIALHQKQGLLDLFQNRNRPDVDEIGCFYIISTAFLYEWRRFIKDPIRHGAVLSINNCTLICPHKKFMYPMMFISEFLTYGEDLDELVCPVTADEWNFINQNFECDQTIKVTVLSLEKKDNLEYDPDICQECVQQWMEGAYRKQFQYNDSSIYVVKREKGDPAQSEEEEQIKENTIFTGKREIKPVIPDAWKKGFSSSSSIRRSQRPRSSLGEKTYKVSSSTTIRELKSKICSDFKALLSDQHLFFGKIELKDLKQTLEEYSIPARAKLFLEIDTAESGTDIEEPMSTNEIETGFQGTLLQGGGTTPAVSDTRSLEHT